MVALVSVSVADTAVLSALHTECFTDYWDETAMGEVLAMPGVIGWIAVDETCVDAPSPVGLILCRHAADEAEILSIGVLAGWRGKGIGWQMLTRGLEEFRRLRLRRIFLEVSERNTSALTLYKRFGFTEVGRRARYYDSKTDAIVLYYEIL